MLFCLLLISLISSDDHVNPVYPWMKHISFVASESIHEFLPSLTCSSGNCRYYAIHKAVYNWFNISFDEFGRTSTPQQTEICQAIFKKLLENNWLSEYTTQQVVLPL